MTNEIILLSIYYSIYILAMHSDINKNYITFYYVLVPLIFILIITNFLYLILNLFPLGSVNQDSFCRYTCNYFQILLAVTIYF